MHSLDQTGAAKAAGCTNVTRNGGTGTGTSGSDACPRIETLSLGHRLQEPTMAEAVGQSVTRHIDAYPVAVLRHPGNDGTRAE